MKQHLYTTALLLPILLAPLSAQTTLFSYGESTDYVTSTNFLSMLDGTTDAGVNDFNRAFSATVNMSPEAPGYAGPAFFGGWETSGSLAQAMDFGPYIRNDWVQTGGFDGIFFDLNHSAFQEGRAAFVLMGDTVPTNLSDLLAFSVSAGRNSGTGNFMLVRAVIRVAGNYYIGSTESSIPGAYTNVSLDLSSWKHYYPATTMLDFSTPPATLAGTAQVDAVGVVLYRGVETTTGVQDDVWMTFGKFVATATSAVEPPVPVLSTSTSGGNLVITVPSESGFDYQLETATSSLGGWTDVPGEVQPGNDGDLTFTQPLPASGAKDFYRVDVTAQ
ncbi:MAG: hypothetical protein ACP5I4_14955 [Oceanipulchritudo sp.]